MDCILRSNTIFTVTEKRSGGVQSRAVDQEERHMSCAAFIACIRILRKALHFESRKAAGKLLLSEAVNSLIFYTVHILFSRQRAGNNRRHDWRSLWGAKYKIVLYL